MALKEDFAFWRGNDVLFTFTMNPVESIAGWSITFTMRANGANPDPASVTKTLGAGVTITDGPNGVFTVLVEDSDTTSLSAGIYDYDCKRMDAGAEATLVYGKITLRQDVTR